MSQIDDAAEIHMMNKLEKYIEENYDSPDWNQIVQMRRIKEIQDIDLKVDSTEKIKEKNELDQLNRLLYNESNENVSPMEVRVKSFNVSRMNLPDDKSPVDSENINLKIGPERSLLVIDDH